MLYEVPEMTLIPQQETMSCWYASAQMLIKWKQDQLLQSLADLAPPDLDDVCRSIRDPNRGIKNSQIVQMAKRLGLKAVPPMSPKPSTIMNWLRIYGPLWVNGQTHIVVIAGVDGMNVKVYDPAPVGEGQIDWRSFQGWYVGGTVSSRDTGRDVETVFLHCP